MSALLVVARDWDEADRLATVGTSQPEKYLSVGFEETEIYDLLGDIKWLLDELDPGCLDNFLYKLEIYGTAILSKKRVKNYLNLSRVLLDKEVISYLEENDLFKNYRIDYGYDEPITKEYYLEFANKLKNICQESLEEKKSIFVFGD